MGRRGFLPNHAPRKNPRRRIVRVSEELFKAVQEHAIPLEDDFEDAVRKMLKMPRRED